MQYYSREARQFLDFIWEDAIHQNTNLDHKDVYRMLGFDYYKPSTLMCKRNFGLTIVNFFMACRVAEAKQFMAHAESRNMTLLEVAHATGYSRRRQFNKHFKAVEDIAPREFWYFLEHFEQTTGQNLVLYQQPKTEKYIPDDKNPTFLSNFLNRQYKNIQSHEKPSK